ncbi:hypothetical protein B9J93_00890 [Vibrio sp. V17_P4S1T151]|uniref:hypothetical protein n=1 Tax=Vibrio TaxID=662 RepID=UPI000B8E3355|nr:MULTISPECIES: hypothetical protein [Vibrio]EGR5855890.1 hypothetical protein [Vibrio parahaemolyticus]MDG3024965.1 hypothetical protein [Vibrio parahaemolyticus]OXX50041.1 hypothetical protein B9J93_00890 [Vibrio sp. V17_P4S1T151]OXX65066.1 hypothetical protein B9J89_04065 [Vibrio sp. V15_P4S5T153]
MLYDLIDGLTKVVDVMITNPKQFTFIAVTGLVLNVATALWIKQRYKNKISKYATTIVALYDTEKVAIELLKENEVEQGNKSTVRSLAYEQGGYSTKVYRSEALKYAKKDD